MFIINLTYKTELEKIDQFWRSILCFLTSNMN